METRAHYILIGLFTIGSAAAILLFALWMTQAGTDRDYERYDIVFTETVSGLNIGSAVQYNGIRVGEVESLSLNPDDPREVWARVRVSATTPIKTDTTAHLTLLNITGASGIELSQGLPDSPRLASTTATIPVIYAEPSSLARLRLNADELLLNLTTLIDSANRVLSEENTAYVARMLDNLDAVTSALAAEQDTVREGLRGFVEAGANLNRLLASIEAQANQYGEPLLSSAVATMQHVEQLARQIDTLIEENADAVTLGLQSLGELDPAMRDLRDTMSNFSAIVSRLEDDPAGFLLGGDNIREYQQ